MKSLRLFLIALIAILSTASAIGQKEYFVEIDTLSGVHSRMDSIPGALYIARGVAAINDSIYIFRGLDRNFIERLYSIDINTGFSLTAPSFPNTGDVLDLVDNLVYDDSSRSFLGIFFDNSSQSYHLSQINTSIGQLNLLGQISGMKSFNKNNVSIDVQNREFILTGKDSAGTERLYILDCDSGFNISNAPLQILIDSLDYITHIQSGVGTNNLIGIYWDESNSIFHSVSIDKSNGNNSIISPLTDISRLQQLEKYYNPITNTYSVLGEDSLGTDRIFNIDYQSGLVRSKVPFPILSDSNDNIIELRMNTLNGRLYALHWDNDLTTSINSFNNHSETLKLYPNPSNGIIDLENFENIEELILLNTNGKFVRTIQPFEQINLSDLTGPHFLKAVFNDGSVQIKKLIIR